MSPADFINIKQKISSSPLLTDVEKKDWLYLLPRMTAEQIKELDRILSIKLPSFSPSPDEERVVRQSADRERFKGEVETKIFAPPPPPSIPPTSPDASVGARGGKSKRDFLPPPWGRKGGGESASITPVSSLQAPKPPAEVPSGRGDLSFLMSLTVNNLRAEKNPAEFFNRLVNTARALLREGRINPLEISEAFAKSPLYQAYLEAGLEKLENEQGGSGTLSQSEFEAVADFRRDLRRLTGF